MAPLTLWRFFDTLRPQFRKQQETNQDQTLDALKLHKKIKEKGMIKDENSFDLCDKRLHEKNDDYKRSRHGKRKERDQTEFRIRL